MAGGGADGAIGPADRASKDLTELLTRLDREIRRLLAALDTARGTDQLVGDREALVTATRVRQQVAQLLTERGQAAVTTIASQRALEAANAVIASSDLPPLPADATDATPELRRIVEGQTAEVAAVFTVAADEMRRAINAGISTGGSLADLVEEVAARLNVAVVRAQAAVDAAVMASGRRALMLQAEATGLDYVFAYVGPNDGKTRPFCKALVGRAVSKARMASLDNGQGLPVRDFCGGYNCRHSWAPLTREDAAAEGLQVLE